MIRKILAGSVLLAAALTFAPEVMAQEASNRGANVGQNSSAVDTNLLNLSPNEAAALSNAQQGITQLESITSDNDTEANQYTYVAPDLYPVNRDAYNFSTSVDGIQMSATCPTGGVGFNIGSYLGGIGFNIANNELPEACANAQQDQLDIVYLRVGLNSAQRLGDAEVRSLDTLVYSAAGERWGATPEELAAAVAMERTVTASSPEVEEALVEAQEARNEELLEEVRGIGF